MTVTPWATSYGVGWQYSNNAGATWLGPPAPASQSQVAGPTGTQRMRQQVTIPAGVAGTWTATVSGDIWDANVNQPAHLYYDGVDQGAVPIAGSRTFTLPAAPGAHTVELWIGQANAGGLTAPAVTFAYAGAYAPGDPVTLCSTCPTGVTGCSPAGTVFAVMQNGALIWVDMLGRAVDPATVQAGDDCAQPPPPTEANFKLTGFFFGDGPDNLGENICDVTPAPASTTGFTLGAASANCYDPTVAGPTMTWANPSTVDFTYGNPPHTSGGVVVQFSSPGMGTLTWPTTGFLDVGAVIVSNAGTNGRRVRATYVSGPSGVSSGNNRPQFVSGTNLNMHFGSTESTTPGTRFRLEII